MAISRRGEIPAQALLAIESGHKIEAIKIVREHTGLGLAEAKTLVDRAARELAPDIPRTAKGREDSGVMRLIIVLLVVGAAAVALFYSNSMMG